MNTNAPPLSTLTGGYFSQQAMLDECFGLEGEVKEHWKRLLKNVGDLSAPELKNRQLEVLKLLQENGVTYNVYGETDGLNRPWL